MAKRKHYSNGIFALETSYWYKDLTDRTSIRPVLSLLGESYLKMPYIFRDVATKEEFLHFIGKWPQTKYQKSPKYPILYLGFHGEKESLCLGDGRMKMENRVVDLVDLAKELKGKCKDKIVIFGSCSTFATDGRRITTFLKKTGALATIGYRVDVGWFASAAFEMLLMGELQTQQFTKSGVKKVRKEIDRQFNRSGLKGDLGYRFIVSGE